MTKKNDIVKMTGLSLAVIMFGIIATPLAFSEGGDDDVAPAPPSIGADIPLTYFGPAPSDVQKELIGP